MQLDFGYGGFEEAILRRSLSYIEKLLQTEQFRKKYPGTYHCGNERYHWLTPVELALGWPDGLQRLLEHGYNAASALALSICMNDGSSTEIILATDAFPGGLGYERTIVLESLCKSRNREIRETVVRALRRRREDLKRLAMERLLSCEFMRLNYLCEKSLDVTAYNVYQNLQEQGVHVPKSLHPATLSDELDHQLVYHILLTDERLPCDPELLDLFFENGFASTDAPDNKGRTPLSRLCEYIVRLRRGFLPDIKWFLEKGACREFSRASRFQNPFYYLACVFGNAGRDSISYYDELKASIRLSASHFDPLDPDCCKCYCSSSGCLPIYKFWKCHALRFNRHSSCQSTTTKKLVSMLDEWLYLCYLNQGPSEKCYKEICRLEIFDRLGMSHTCCTSQLHIYEDEAFEEIPREELREVQDEDKDLQEQLDLLMCIYDNARSKHIGSLKEFWEDWMESLDEILPDLRPGERCITRFMKRPDYYYYRNSAGYLEAEETLHAQRIEIEEKALAKKGYLGLDFLDVIKLHFAEFLDPQEHGSSSTSSWVTTPGSLSPDCYQENESAEDNPFELCFQPDPE